MKFVIQRVSEAACRIDEKVSGEISRGFLVLIGISNEDTREIADKMIKKLINMRIFDDEMVRPILILRALAVSFF